MDAATRCNCDLNQDYNAAEPHEDSSLVLDFIKRAAANSTASTLASLLDDQDMTNAADVNIKITESQQRDGSKYLPSDAREKIVWSQHRVSPVPVVLPAVHSESDSEGSMPSYGQSQQRHNPGITSGWQRWSRTRQDPAGISYVRSGRAVGAEGSKLLLQDLECGQSGGDLVQVRVAQRARHELWTGVHHSSWQREGGLRAEWPFRRSWASGRNSGLLAEVPLEGSHGGTPGFGGTGHAALLDEERSLPA